MNFNSGFICKKCGPMKTAKKSTVKGVPYDLCPHCLNLVTEWEKPLNERIGHCGKCGNAGFILAIGKNKLKGVLIRKCKKCGEMVNPDDKVILKEGRLE